MRKTDIIISSKILSSFSELSHGISTKQGGNSPFYNNMSLKVGDEEQTVKNNRNKFFSSLRIDQNMLAIPQQIHSDKILVIDKPGYYKDTDGLITVTTDIYLIISTADCYSVLIYDKVNKAIGNIHSGWRGTQKKIVTKAVELMKKEFSSKTEKLSVYIGPGISRDNFEVGKEVAEMFEKKFTEIRNGKYFVDLKLHIIDQLNTLGINHHQIEAYPHCTFLMKDYLHSYRRDRDKSGRMFSVIGIRR
jgi:YfiH family protein